MKMLLGVSKTDHQPQGTPGILVPHREQRERGL